MQGVAAWMVSGLGVIVIAAVLRDLFHTLFHPGGQGALSRRVLVFMWRSARRVGGPRRLGELAGPLGLVGVIGVWGLLVVVGGALVYWPHISEDFSYGAGLDPDGRSDVLDAVYVSLVTTSTLGFGDVVPTAGWLRVVTPLQALIGFALLTVAVSWVLQVYPALSRRRLLASRLTSLQRAAMHEAIRQADSSLPAAVLEDLARQVAGVSVDLSQYAETHYFRDRETRFALAACLPYAEDLAAIGRVSSRADLRLAATDLVHALADLAESLRPHVSTTERTPTAVFRAYAEDHGETDVLRSPSAAAPSDGDLR